MVPTLEIRQALLAALLASDLFETVIVHSDSDLTAALEHLRDSPSSLCVIVPGEDRFEHTLEPGTTVPVYTEVSNTFELLIAARSLDMAETGADESLTIKDAVAQLLLWSDLGIADLLCLPQTCEPIAIQFDSGTNKGREAWKLTLILRHTLVAG